MRTTIKLSRPTSFSGVFYNKQGREFLCHNRLIKYFPKLGNAWDDFKLTVSDAPFLGAKEIRVRYWKDGEWSYERAKNDHGIFYWAADEWLTTTFGRPRKYLTLYFRLNKVK